MRCVSCPLCVQPVSVTLRAPSAASVRRSGASVSVKPTSSGDAATSARRQATALKQTAAWVGLVLVLGQYVITSDRLDNQRLNTLSPIL